MKFKLIHARESEDNVLSSSWHQSFIGQYNRLIGTTHYYRSTLNIGGSLSSLIEYLHETEREKSSINR